MLIVPLILFGALLLVACAVFIELEVISFRTGSILCLLIAVILFIVMRATVEMALS